MEVLGQRNQKNKQNYEGKKLCWQFFNHVEPYGAHVAAKLDHVVSCGELVGCHEGLCTARKNIKQKNLLLGNFHGHLEATQGHARLVLVQCWVTLAHLEGLSGSMTFYVAPCGAHVGAMLGHVVSCGGLRGQHGCLWNKAKNITQIQNFCWEFSMAI